MNAIEDTRHWLERAVIGLNLCPFAKAVHVKEQIRWVESLDEDPEQLLEDLVRELEFLAAADPAVVETPLLIHPRVLTDFLDYNDFLDVADAAVESLRLAGVHVDCKPQRRDRVARDARDGDSVSAHRDGLERRAWIGSRGTPRSSSAATSMSPAMPLS